jgi:hypothetical protein
MRNTQQHATVWRWLAAALIISSLAACTGAGVAPSATITAVPTIAPATSLPLATPTPMPTTQGSSYSDPFSYCAAVGTIDTPDSRYSGPAMPDAIAQGLKTASGASADVPLEIFKNGSYWRCMGAKVYACFVGANLPCDSKANMDKTPTSAEADYCKSNPNSDFIPAAVTGHDTIYAWRCNQDTPVIDKQVFHVDSQGYIQEIWYQISSP